MKQIETRFDEVISTLEDSEYTKDEITAEIGKYRDTIDESIAICVTGLCSAGKSAFINSLIGYEILPSSSDPTTAKMFKITCSDAYSVSFEINGQTITVSFNDDGYTVSDNCPSELDSKINSVFADDMANTRIKNMHCFLDCLNKGKLLPEVGKVDISIPFRQMTYFDSHYQFVIYDTPGSNSDSNRKHFDILKEALSKQTNALLILLTTPDTMDYTDNNNLLDLIQETGESLDTSNAIIVVNKGDMLTPSSLAEKRERYQSLKITKWKSTRIFFLSSVIALASKKDDPDDKSSWIDEDAFDAYDDRCRKFARGDKVLYKYNIIDKPNERSSHTRITLRGGGIIFYLGALAYFLTNQFEYPWFMLALTLVTVISFVDDIRSISQGLRLVFHFTAMGLMFYQWELFTLPWWTVVVALIACTGIINAYNFMDGINGITGGYSLVVLGSLAFINHWVVSFVEPDLIYTMLCAVLVFNFFNFRKRAKCFAGDVGSVSIAFIILFLIGKLIIDTEDFSWIVLLAVYGADSVLTIVHRLMLHENIGLPHRKHLYQIMANELKIPHVAVSLTYMVVQGVVVAGYLVLREYGYVYLAGSILLLSILYLLFMKRFFHLHQF